MFGATGLSAVLAMPDLLVVDAIDRPLLCRARGSVALVGIFL
jgi:hypothetical protein